MWCVNVSVLRLGQRSRTSWCSWCSIRNACRSSVKICQPAAMTWKNSPEVSLYGAGRHRSSTTTRYVASRAGLRNVRTSSTTSGAPHVCQNILWSQSWQKLIVDKNRIGHGHLAFHFDPVGRAHKLFRTRPPRLLIRPWWLLSSDCPSLVYTRGDSDEILSIRQSPNATSEVHYTLQQCNIANLRVLANCRAWNYAPVKIHGLQITFNSQNFQIQARNSIPRRSSQWKCL